MAAPIDDVGFAFRSLKRRPAFSGTSGNVSFPTYRDLRTAGRSLSGVAAFYTATPPLVRANLADDITAALGRTTASRYSAYPPRWAAFFTPAVQSRNARPGSASGERSVRGRRTF